MNYRNSSIKTGSSPDISFLRKNYLMSYKKFNSQFKPKTRNAVLHKPLSKVSYEYNDYDDMNSYRRNNSCMSQKDFTGYGTKVQYVLEDNSNHISDKIKCFKQGDNNEDVFDVREYQRLIKKREDEIYNKYKESLSLNKNGLSIVGIKDRYSPEAKKDYYFPMLSKIAKKDVVCVNPYNDKASDDLGDSFLAINPILHPVDSYVYEYNRFKKKRLPALKLSRSAVF